MIPYLKDIKKCKTWETRQTPFESTPRRLEETSVILTKLLEIILELSPPLLSFEEISEQIEYYLECF